jgi:hypothetical protein
MADDSTNRIAHQFFLEKLNTLEPFGKEDLMAVTGWDKSSADTYWSKQYKNILEDIGGGKYRVRERFRNYQSWKKFKQLVTQVKAAPAKYKPTTFDTVVVYEFYMPLTHEAALKTILDSLFYKDIVLPRLKHRIGTEKLKKHFDYSLTDTDDSFLEKVCVFIDSKFGGYSIYHVDGRFRAGKLVTQDESAQMGKAGTKYLLDETTAVTRFVFPCKTEEVEKVRFLFEELFVDPITEQVSGEDEIWVVESGNRNQVKAWKPQN